MTFTLGRSADYLRQVADQAVADGNALDHAAVGMFRIDTDGRTVAESADLIATMTGPGYVQCHPPVPSEAAVWPPR